MTISTIRVWSVAAVTGILTAAAGCGGSSSDLPLGRVEGVVTLDGEPYPGALVEFNPQTPKKIEVKNKKKPLAVSGSLAVTDANGKYQLQLNNELKGAVVGVHTVKVSTLPDDVLPPKLIPVKYGPKSNLTFEVVEGENNYDLELTSK